MTSTTRNVLALTTVIALGSTLMATPAAAGVILMKELNLSQFGWNSNQPNNLQQSTDDVQLASSATVDRIEWYGFRGAGTDQFRIRFFTGVVENAVTVHFYQDDVTANFVDTGLDHFGFDVLLYSADITDIVLTAGTRYEMSIMSLNPSVWTWNFSNLEPNDPQYHRNGDSDPWREIGSQGLRSHAFTLFGESVPEPASLLLLLTGLAAGLAARRRSRS